MINFLNLEYFLVAAEELNFTKAAKRLYISQQSLSNHISNMEKEFDVILFNRTTPLTLTYAGQALKQKARQMLELKDEMHHELSDIKDFSVGQLVIGLSHMGRVTLVLQAIVAFVSIFGLRTGFFSDGIHGIVDMGTLYMR